MKRANKEEFEKILNMTEEEQEEFFENWWNDRYEEPDYDYDDIPEGCKACGGPYPDCTTSCKMFDD